MAKDRAMDALSRRVHDKLLDQRQRLAAAVNRINFLERDSTGRDRERHQSEEGLNINEPVSLRAGSAERTMPQAAWSSEEDGAGAARSLD